MSSPSRYSSHSDDLYANTQDFNAFHSVGPGLKKKWFPEIFAQYAQESPAPRTPLLKGNMTMTDESYEAKQ